MKIGTFFKYAVGSAGTVLLFCGCTTLVPYVHPGVRLPRQDRMEMYNNRRVEGWIWPETQGRWLTFYELPELASYYRHSGDETDAQRMEDWKTDYWAVLGMQALGLALMAAEQVPAMATRDPASTMGFTGAGLFLGGLGLDFWSRATLVWPARDSFNRHLREDLRLDPSRTVPGPVAGR